MLALAARNANKAVVAPVMGCGFSHRECFCFVFSHNLNFLTQI